MRYLIAAVSSVLCSLACPPLAIPYALVLSVWLLHPIMPRRRLTVLTAAPRRTRRTRRRGSLSRLYRWVRRDLVEPLLMMAVGVGLTVMAGWVLHLLGVIGD